MKILRTYLLKELLQPTITAFILFTFVMLVGNLVKLTDLLINRGVSIFSILHLFGLMVPEMLIYTVPMAVLTGTLLAFGRLSSEREILAMKACGISFFSIAWPVLLVGLVCSLALIPINHEVVPWSHYARRKAIPEVILRNPAAFLEPGTFIREFKPYVLFFYDIRGNKLSKIRIYEPREGYPTRTIVAERGEFLSLPAQRRVVLKLYQGSADEPDSKDPTKFFKLEFQTYSQDLLFGQEYADKTKDQKPKDMSLRTLREETQRLQSEGIDPTPLRIEYQRRTSMAFSPLAFILVGLPTGITTRRAQRLIGFVLSVPFFLGYYILLIVGQTLAQKGLLPSAPAMWLGNGIFLALGAVLFWRACRA